MQIPVYTFLVLAVAASFSFAAAPPQHKRPIPIDQAQLQALKAKFTTVNKLSPGGNAAVRSSMSNGQNAAAASLTFIKSIPNWSGAFAYKGAVYPYVMAGNSPPKGGSTWICPAIVPVSFLFDEFVDQNGNNITIDVGPVIEPTITGPNWDKGFYTTGYTQFGDAVQRAEFYSSEKADWHTLLTSPRMLKPVTVEVPVGLSQLYQLSDGTLFSFLDANFFNSQLNTISQLENINVTELWITLSKNTFLYDAQGCCILGFHGAYEVGQSGSTFQIQTYAWASWVGTDVGPQVFGPGWGDVLPLSHEISEWMNDPFTNNAVPAWEYPDNSGCGDGALETGDPIEVLPDPSYPVPLHGFTYHPQNEALLQWFSRESPSNAIEHAYSFPNTSLLKKPSQPCH